MLVTVLLLAVGMLQQDWYTYEPDGKNFRVELPSKPNSTTSRTATTAAGRSQVTIAQLRTPDATYTIQLTESPARVNPKTLDDGIQKYAAASRGDLGDIATITVDDQPGREFEMTERSVEGQKHSKMRWLAVGNSLLMLTVTAKPGGKLSQNADRFLGSLEFGPAKSGKIAQAKPTEPARAKPSEPARAKPSDTARVRPNDGARAKAEEFVPGEVAGKDEESAEDKSKAETKPARKLTTLSKVTAKSIPKSMKAYAAEDLDYQPRSFLERDRNGFRDIGPEGSVLAGVRVSYVERFGGPKIRSVQPIYRLGTTLYQGRIYGEYVGPFATFVATPGYAVGGLVTHTGLTVDGFGIVFMKVNGDHLEPDDTYNSPWIGDRKGGSPGGVNSQGDLVVGLQGRADREVNALGMMTLK